MTESSNLSEDVILKIFESFSEYPIEESSNGSVNIRKKTEVIEFRSRVNNLVSKYKINPNEELRVFRKMLSMKRYEEIMKTTFYHFLGMGKMPFSHVVFFLPGPTRRLEEIKHLILKVDFKQFESFGMYIWEGGLFLLELIYSNHNLFREKTVIELGCGLGHAGVILNWYSKPKQILLTDVDDSVLRNCEKNCELNENSDKVNIFKLDWRKRKMNSILTQNLKNVDVILAAEVGYDRDLIVPFLKTVKEIFSVSSIDDVFCIVVVRKKGDGNVKYLKDNASCLGMSVEERRFETQELFQYERKGCIALEIRKK